MKKLSKLLFSVCLALATSTARGAIDPSIDWHVIETKNFEVIFDAKYRQIAIKYAEAAERAHILLGPVFDNVTPNKTILVIDDSTDVSNGFATPIPRQLITVYPVLPNSLDYLSHFGNWAQEIVTHEYTHTLTFEPAYGFWRPLRTVFGSVIRPNALLPRWYTEGVAVQNESKFTSMGRLRSPLYRAMIRSQVLENVWGTEGLDRANDLTNPTWPRGSRPYFYGALVWNRLVEKKDDQIQGELNRRYATRVPYLLHAPILDNYDQDFNDFLQTTYTEFETIAKTQIERLSSQPSTDTDGAAFEIQDGYFQHSPRVSPDGTKLVVSHRSNQNSEEFYLVERASKTESFQNAVKKIGSGYDSVTKISWLPDSKSLIFDAVDTYNRVYQFSDLYTLEIENKKVKKLTNGQRLREASVSPDGSQIVAVKLGASQTWIVALDRDGKNERILYTPEPLFRVSNPEYAGSEQLIFSERGTNGVESLKRLNLKTNAVETVLRRYEPIQFAHIADAGLVFQSIKSGAGNLYLANSDLTDARPITHTKTHIFNGTYDTNSNEAFVTRLTSRGAQIQRILPTSTSSPLPTTGLNDGYQFGSFFEPEPEVIETESNSYQAHQYLWPQYWLPIVFSGPYGSQYGGTVYGSDPLNFHDYYLGGYHDALANRPGFLAGYTNRQTPIVLSVNGQDTYTYVESVKLNNHQTYIAGMGSFYLPLLSNNWLGSLGWTYFQSEYERSPISTQQGPSASIRYSNTTTKGYQISPETGWAWDLAHTEYLEGLATDSYGRTTASVTKYLSWLLPKNHALKLSTAGTYSPANRSLFVGTVAGGGEYFYGNVNQALTVRGYAPGAFLGWSFLTTSMEYRFPLAYQYKGSGTAPWFLRRTHGAVFWDALSTEGAYADIQTGRLTNSYFGNFYSGVGAEVRFDMTVVYMAPITVRVGYHYGLRHYASGGGGVYLGLALPQF